METHTASTVKFRSEDTVSERQLVLALATHGRTVALEQLGNWRKDGLLPPLASCGTGNGRSYYWREPAIVAQAECVYDAMQRHGRADTTVITLWLQGFAVPLPALRRAWLHRARTKGPAKLRKTKSRMDMGDDVTGLLMKALLGLGLAADDDALATLLPLLRRLDCKASRDTSTMALGVLTVLTAGMLENGTLMRDAEDADLLAAQRHMRTVLLFLEQADDRANPRAIAEALGPGLFLLILALLHTDQAALLDRLLAQLPKPGGKGNGAGRHAPGPVIQPYRITA